MEKGDIKIIKESIRNELVKKNFAMTKEYEKQNLNPIINDENTLRYIMDSIEDEIVVFVPIENRNFHLAYKFVHNKFDKIIDVFDYPGIRIDFSITTDSFTTDSLCQMTKLKPDRICNKGDIANLQQNLKSNLNEISFVQDFDRPNYFHSKFKTFLKHLTKDLSNINRLSDLTKCNDIWITVCYNSHYPLSIIDINKECIKLLDNLSMNVFFDIYSE